MRLVSIVDDDESLRRAVRNLLLSVGFPVETFASAVILTAHGDDVARRRTMQAGAIAFLGKPFCADALLDAVRSALDQPRR